MLRAFRRRAAAQLRAAGFFGPKGHLLRRRGAVTQIIELQHSVYGGRVTANLGVDLEWLKPNIRWIPRPELGPHAHDATRWVRLGLVSPEAKDTWWAFTDEAGSVEEAVEGLAQSLLSHGLPWFEGASAPEAFLTHAEERLRRSQTADRPQGGYMELRLMAAISAWRGAESEAAALASLAAAEWEAERRRLTEARALYRAHFADKGARLARVPDLQAELVALISPTTDEPVFLASAAAPKPRRSRRRPSRAG